MGTDRFQLDRSRGRFAPSTTGRAHPGTLLAALLCWLDVRSRGGEIVLRLEDLDLERTRPGHVEAMQRDLEWFGLDWDVRTLQSEQRALHEEALEALVERGVVYACECSRARIRAHGERAPDGAYRYPGTCRDRGVSLEDWRATEGPLRLWLEAAPVVLRDESGLDLSGDAQALFGDPLLRRRDGAFAYHFVSVLDDAEAGVGRVVRGRDLAPATSLQVALQGVLDRPTPVYRHHGLLLERSGEKLSKLHGAVDVEALRRRYEAPELCGLLAGVVGLVPAGTSCRPAELVSGFDWARVVEADIELCWDERDGLAPVATL